MSMQCSEEGEVVKEERREYHQFCEGNCLVEKGMLYTLGLNNQRGAVVLRFDGKEWEKY